MPGVEETLHEFKHGTLHSGSKHGPTVTNRKQAIAIALNQARKAGLSAPPAPAREHAALRGLRRAVRG